MNVLVVDDQHEVVQAVVNGVHWENLPVEKVFPAYSVKEAKSLMEIHKIDLLLCDIEMPPASGFELVRWAQMHWPHIITIFLSSHADFEYARKAVKLGSFDYVLQPAPYEEIERSILRAIERAGAVSQRLGAARGYQIQNLPAEDLTQDEEKRPVEKAKEYIRKNISRSLSRTEIAEAVFLNPEYLSHLFKKETGSSLGDFILEEKMIAAKSLLKDTNIKVSVIASKVGFSNFSYFSSVFKKSTGLTPIEYRALWLNNSAEDWPIG